MRGLGSLAPILAFVVGFVDTAVFVHMGGLFVAHVTGNLVLLGATLAGRGIGGAHGAVVGLQLASFPIFFLAAVAATALGSALKRGADFPLAPMLWIATTVMAVAVALAIAMPRGAAASMVLVVAMGILNAVHRLDTRLGPPFTVMTGNVTAHAIAFAKLIRAAPGIEAVKGVPALVRLVIGFTLGAATGALADGRFGLAAIALPMLLLAAHLAFVLRAEAAR
jgi:uncharacterized membrane protein YoaK (UPF0700 family)